MSRELKKQKKSEVKASPFYSECVKIYFDFIIDRTGFKPVWSDMQGKVMKEFIKWMEENKKAGFEPPEVLAAILNNYEHWEPFNKKQLKINEIFSNVINIINFIKNANRINQTNNANQYRSRKEQLRERTRGAIE